MPSDSHDYFDQIAEQWDQMREGFFSGAIRERAFQVAAVGSEATALDMGAGTGFITEGLLARGAQVIAVDQSSHMLDELQRKFGHRAGLDCRVGEEQSIPVPDGSVDFVFANMYLHHVEDPPGAIREMARVLKPGGKLVLTDLDQHDYEFLRTEQHDRWLGFDRDDVTTWFAGAELIDVTVDGIGENCTADSSEGTCAAVSIFVAAGTKRSGQR